MQTKTLKSLAINLFCGISSAILCGAARAEEPVGVTTNVLEAVVADSAGENESDAPEGWNYVVGEGVAYGEQPVVSCEASLAFHSKNMTYGLVDNNEPILMPMASMTLCDWISVGFESYFDITSYGARKVAGEELYGNRAWRYTEFDPYVSLDHAFSAEDYEWLPTDIEFSLCYLYQYMPRSLGAWGCDSQFVSLEVSLPELWVEPTFLYERDIMFDNGTYLFLELGHTFDVVEDVFTLRPSIGQGFGNSQRVSGYLCKYGTDEPLDHAGLMDTSIKLTGEWTICDWLALSGYVAYSDFLFDRKIREASREYEASGKWDHSYNFVCGLMLTASF